MATKADRKKAEKLIDEGMAKAEAGAKLVEQANELLGKPPFHHTRLFGATGELHDLRAFAGKLRNYAYADIYHEEK